MGVLNVMACNMMFIAAVMGDEKFMVLEFLPSEGGEDCNALLGGQEICLLFSVLTNSDMLYR